MTDTTRKSLDSELTFADRLDQHKRTIGIAGIVILLGMGGAWYYSVAKAKRAANAEAALQQGLRSAMAGNVPLAQADLKKASVRYAGTAAGTQAAMALAKLGYNAGKYQEGIDALKAIKPADELRYDYHTLIAAGYEGLNKSAEAAAEYMEAAKGTEFEPSRDAARANAARAYQAAGKRDDAVKIWTDLAKDPDAPLAPEARVRLGELEAKAMRVGS